MDKQIVIHTHTLTHTHTHAKAYTPTERKKKNAKLTISIVSSFISKILKMQMTVTEFIHIELYYRLAGRTRASLHTMEPCGLVRDSSLFLRRP